MRECVEFYIDGAWVPPAETEPMDVINPATGEATGTVYLGLAADVDRAVAAARAAFPAWAATSREERLAALQRVVETFHSRIGDLAAAITEEMGAPRWLAEGIQAPIGQRHFENAIEVLRTYRFEEDRGSTRVVREPVGVCGFITPWNWPVHQICAKVAPALAAGCTTVLKPSEIAPFSAQIFAEIMDAAALPPGVFNLIQGAGPVAGAAMAAHPDIDMISITGSTRAGRQVARAAAESVKRVHQELGGKSPNIILEDADLEASVTAGVNAVMQNSGQSCRAPTRMLVPRGLVDAACEIARRVAEDWTPGDPRGDSRMGPVVSEAQWNKVQRLIQSGIDEGAHLVAGGTGRPEGLERGYFVRPTIFRDVDNDMEIAREEIFGPVLCIIPYESEEEAVRIANDTEYGLAGYVSSRDMNHARAVAARIRAGYISINGAGLDLNAPFGGYKHSGNGREFSKYGFEEFLELKAVLGYVA